MSRKAIFTAGLIILGLVIVLTILTLMLPSMMKPTNTSPDTLAQISPGEDVSVVAQVIEIEGNVLRVEILEGNGYDVFDQRTGIFLEAEQTPEMKIVMGEPADVSIGAIAQFDGTKVDAAKMRLSRIVILTGYVKGPRQP